ncbi:hypothetical protein NMY22_g12537 [Coprinellus aureogranulatus]|nr:hypothetical protein NMY22_g12537 [Coprinellus aureogranulatus]
MDVDTDMDTNGQVSSEVEEGEVDESLLALNRDQTQQDDTHSKADLASNSPLPTQFLVISAKFPDARALAHSIGLLCTSRGFRSGLLSVHKLPTSQSCRLPNSQDCELRFVLEMEHALQATLLYRHLPGLPSSSSEPAQFISATEAAALAMTSSDFWTSTAQVLASSDERLAGAAWGCARPNPYPPQSDGKAQRHKPIVARPRAGVRQGLYLKTGMHFWDWLKVMTDEEFAACSPEEQAYITERRGQKQDSN